MIGHQRQPPELAVLRQRQNGDRSAVVERLEGLTRAFDPVCRCRRAEMIARQIPDFGLVRRDMDRDRQGRLQAGQRGDQLTPHPNQDLCRKAIAGRADQTAQELRLPGRSQRQPAAVAVALDHGDLADDVGAFDQEVENRLIDPVDFGAENVETAPSCLHASPDRLLRGWSNRLSCARRQSKVAIDTGDTDPPIKIASNRGWSE
ncbi:MAG: hypothetical protein OET79_06885, partial [Nitrospirota bacterium]|nr:hypothetical protein [Nitrospirota bacterium]